MTKREIEEKIDIIRKRIAKKYESIEKDKRMIEKLEYKIGLTYIVFITDSDENTYGWVSPVDIKVDERKNKWLETKNKFVFKKYGKESIRSGDSIKHLVPHIQEFLDKLKDKKMIYIQYYDNESGIWLDNMEMEMSIKEFSKFIMVGKFLQQW